jgi:hypothetical protein
MINPFHRTDRDVFLVVKKIRFTTRQIMTVSFPVGDWWLL